MRQTPGNVTWALLWLALIYVGCAHGQEPRAEETPGDPPATASVPAPATTSPLSFAEATNRFTFELWGALESRENAVVSPTSVYLALAMTSAGATGETAREMARVLHLGDDPESLHLSAQEQLARWRVGGEAPYVLTVANRLFADRSLTPSPDFLRLTRERYGASMKTLPIRTEPEPSRAAINGWIAEITREKIPELLPQGSLSAQSRMVLANAIYFKGPWRHPFDEERTAEGPFYVSDNEAIQTPMMTQKEDLRFTRTDHVSVVELPYSGGALSMILVLPHDRMGLARLETALTTQMFQGWMERLHMARVNLRIPRFRVAPPTALSLKPPLEALGMPGAFGPQAEFHNIGPDLQISDVFHKAIIEVNEEGAEAAAATAVVMRTKSMPRIAEFYADHPFLFFLRDRETSTILFIGRVSNPVVD